MDEETDYTIRANMNELPILRRPERQEAQIKERPWKAYIHSNKDIDTITISLRKRTIFVIDEDNHRRAPREEENK